MKIGDCIPTSKSAGRDLRWILTRAAKRSRQFRPVNEYVR